MDDGDSKTEWEKDEEDEDEKTSDSSTHTVREQHSCSPNPAATKRIPKVRVTGL